MFTLRGGATRGHRTEMETQKRKEGDWGKKDERRTI